MKKFTELLQSLNSKVDKETIKETFSKLADELINNIQIKSVVGKLYNIEEVEFYFRNKEHNDTSTHMHCCSPEVWRVHYSGIDISFGSSFNETNMPKTPPKNCDDETYYGGILIRSISLNEDGKTEFINGPLRVQTTILTGSSIYEKGNCQKLELVNEKKRKVDINKTTRCGVNNPEEYKQENYCFYNSDTTGWLQTYKNDKNNKDRLK